MFCKNALFIAAITTIGAASSAAFGATTFTEHFSSGNANWTQNDNTAAIPVTTGGPQGVGDAFIQTNYLLPTTTTGTPVVVRATGSNGASGGAFTGSYANVSEVTVYVRHNYSAGLPIGLRLGGSTPGTALVIGAPLVAPSAPGDWTQLTFQLNPSNPNILSYEGTSGATNAIKFATVVAGISNLQLFLNLADPTYVPPAVATSVQFSTDHVTVPEPTSLALLGLGGCAALRRRRAR